MNAELPLRRIISGGQTGADRGGLEAAVQLNLDVGGTVPRGRKAEDGPISWSLMTRYRLVESVEPGYAARTEANVRNSDATVIFSERDSTGSRLTVAKCKWAEKPYLISPSAKLLRLFVKRHGVVVLNVAGNRESVSPGIYARVLVLLKEALR